MLEAKRADNASRPLEHGPPCRPVAVLDIGGTTTRVARFDAATGGHMRVRRSPTPNYLTHAGSSADQIIRMLRDSVARDVTTVLDHETVDSIIVGWPGPVTGSGVALRSPTILGPDNVDTVNVAAMLSELWPNAAIHVLNDLTCAGYSFVRSGHYNFCVLTVGSGVGNKIFLGGKPFVGDEGFGGEIGHVRVSPRRGTPVADARADLGTIASGRGTVSLAKLWAERRPEDFRNSVLADVSNRYPDQLWSERLVAAFRGADALASAIIEAAAQPLAEALSHIHLGLGITRFFVTGGFASALGEKYRRMLVGILQESAWDLGQDWDSMVIVSDAPSEDGLLGACYLASLICGTRPTNNQLLSSC